MREPDFNHIDQQFFRHLSQLKAPVSDPDQLWSRIISQQKRRRSGIIFLLVLLIPISIGAFMYTGQVQDKNNLQAQQTDNPKGEENISDRTTVHSENQNNLQPDRIDSEDSENEIQKSGLTNHNQKNDLEKENILKLMFTQNANVAETHENELVHLFLEIASSSSAEFSSGHMSTTDNTHLRNTNNVFQNDPSEHRPVHDQIKFLATVPALKTITSEYSSSFLEILELEAIKSKNRLEPCDIKASGNFFADVYGQANLSMDQLNLAAEQSADLINYRDEWNDRFNTLSSFIGGVMVGYSFPWKGSIAAGIEYQHVEAEYQFLQTVTERITVYDPMAYFYYDTNNDIVWVGDSVTAVSVYDRRVSFGNQHSLINVPIQFSYDLNRKGALRIAAQAGASFNISHRYRGQFLLPDQNLIPIDSRTDNGFMSKSIGLSMDAAVYMGYLLSERWEVYINPRFRYHQGNYLDKGQLLTLNRHLFGLRAGIQYHF